MNSFLACKLALALLLVSLSSIAAGQSSTSQVVVTWGDADFFGFPVGVLGDPVPAIDFDNRDVDDPLYTDVDARLGVSVELEWAHDVSGVTPPLNVMAATLTLGLGGVQDGAFPEDDSIFLNGSEIPAAFDAIDMGPTGTGLLSFDLSPEQLLALQSTGYVDVRIRGFVVSTPDPGLVESYFVDFSTLELTLGSGSVVTDTLGDCDFFGFEPLGSCPFGALVPAFDFDNRAPGDPAFTDFDARLDASVDIAWSESIVVAGIEPTAIMGGVLWLAIGGIQDGAFSDPEADDKLFVNGVEINAAFDLVDQGPFGTGLLEFVLPPPVVDSLVTTGTLAVSIEGLLVTSIGVESYFIDQVGLTLDVQELFHRGDCNQDGGIDIGDPIRILGILFSGDAPPDCDDACDHNDDGALDIGDSVYLLGSLFSGGPTLPAPNPTCGIDPTLDSLTCGSFASCP